MSKNTGITKEDRLSVMEDKRGLPVFVKYGLIAAGVILAIVVGLLVWYNIAGSYVGTINGQKIKTSEFEYYLKAQKQAMYNSVASSNISEETFWTTPIDGEDPVELAKEIVLNSLKEVKVQYAKAKEAGVALTKEDTGIIDSYIKSNIIEVFGQGNKIKANSAFEEMYNLSIDEFRNIQLENFTISKYWSEEITEEKANVDTYYVKNPEWYKEDTQFRAGSEEAVWARHILIMFGKDASQEDKDAAKKKAEELIEKIKAGEDFATLAKEHSGDPGSSGKGGEYLFGKGRMYADFEKAAFSLEPGQFTEIPVLTESGYHIIKLEEKYAKDEPVSLRCAKEYNEYGTDFVRYKLISGIVNEWMEDAVYKENTDVYNSIK